MNEWLLQLAQTIDELPWSTALHESLYAYPLIETTHVLFLGLFVGTLVMVDLRLLGLAFKSVPVTDMHARVLPFTVIGLVVMLVTGLLLYFAIPVRTTQNVFFRVKVALLVIAGINAWLLHRQLQRSQATHGRATDVDQLQHPGFVRGAATVSLLAWAGIIVCGRMIAYNWFDCEWQPQSDFINTFAGCLVELAQIAP